MREIVFRGKRIFDNGQWVEGCLLKVTLDGETWHLIFGDDFQRSGLGITAMQHAAVNPATVGQYTGLKDKNGKRIFEGDIVKVQNEIMGSPFDEEVIGKITYIECAYFIEPENPMESLYLYDECAVYEVIGNIHDNHELLEVL